MLGAGTKRELVAEQAESGMDQTSDLRRRRWRLRWSSSLSRRRCYAGLRVSLRKGEEPPESLAAEA